MKSTLTALLIASSLLGTSMTAFAQVGPDHKDGGPGGGGQPSHQAAGGNDHGAPGGNHGGGNDHGAPGGSHGGAPVPHRDWHQGGRVPSDYRNSRYVVGDWHSHGLHQPPRGYHWIDVNGDYVLASIATGVISSILLAPHQ